MPSFTSNPFVVVKRPLGTISTSLLATALSVFLVSMPLSAQSASVQTAPAQSAAPQAPRPQWELDAGGKAEFDVASVKQDNAPLSPQTVHTNIPLGPMDAYSPTGGLLSATNIPMLQYLVFAYKLSNYQVQVLFPTLPKWANTDHYDIQARASGNPTKDQFRLMMQALLADRFKLAIHYETRQLPVLALVLDKPGKMGPSLVQHPDSVACSTALPPPNPTPGGPPATIDGKLPVGCGAVAVWLGTGRVHAGARNITLAVLATQLTGLGNGIDRPVLDKTGLNGKFDLSFEYALQVNGPLPPGTDFQPDDSAPPFLEALKQELGIKLESQTGPVSVVVVDHIEQPSEN